MLAFALVAFVVSRLPADTPTATRRRAFALGLLAGVFATLPDVDMLYAPVGLLWADGGPLALAEGFWSASTVVHRSVTHSLVVGVVAAVGFALWTRGGASKLLAVVVLGGLVAVSGTTSGLLGGLVMGAFVLGGLLVGTLAARRGVDAGAVFVTALVGLLSHPFGDLLTGEPPRLLYPFETVLVAERVTLSLDPTLHLLGAMLVELGTFWLAALVYLHLSDHEVRDYVDPTVALGLPSGGVALAVPAPTLSLSYPFVLTLLGVGLACGILVGGVDRYRARERHRPLTMALTALATVTLAVFVYLGAYLVT
nr:metal-dependent hydrolase [Halomarina oriensis]